MPSVAFQGEPGAFSEDAAQLLVGGAQTYGYPTFEAVAAAVDSGEVDYALLPVENSIAGAVTQAYDLLWKYERLRIVNEIVHRVVQSLIGLTAATLEEIEEVRSHPVALEQCRNFLSTYPHWRVQAAADTAGAVRDIVRAGDPRIAAIASQDAATRYGATVLAEAVQDARDNFTRFFLIAREQKHPEDTTPTRACIALTLPHRPGALRDALSAFADLDLNLRSLVARPALGGPFTYRFYCEIERVNEAALNTALSNIQGTSRVLGLY